MAIRSFVTVVLFLALQSAQLTSQRGQDPKRPQDPTAAATAKTDLPPALEIQVRLDRAGFSPGEIDGASGPNTRRAEAAAAKFGRSLDSDAAEIVTAYVIRPEDVEGPFTQNIPGDLMEQSKLEALGYSSALEALGEKFHSSPALLKRLNPAARFAAGETITVPNVNPRGFEWLASGRGDKPAAETGRGDARGRAGAAPALRIVVSKSASTLTVLDDKDGFVFHAPVTSGSDRDPLPLGNWAVTTVARRPTFNYNPDLFWDADPSHAKAKIAPGPNNPVGLVWIDLTKEHYGIHGTPEPGRIGHTQSHGCVRLTNWDALHVAGLVGKGTKVIFEK